MGAMLPDRFAALVNLAGFVAALTLYAMLLAMVIRGPHGTVSTQLLRARSRGVQWPWRWRHEPLLVGTAVLGLVWNAGAFSLYGLEDFGLPTPPLLAALAFTALGFLPAVVVHAALRPALAERHDPAAGAIVGAGYCLGATAGGLHLAAAARNAPLPSPSALWLLVIGFAALVVLLAIRARREARARTLSLAALAVFAVSALHLASHEALRDSWPVELIGHHASLPLALAILYQDYPFALADLFLKRVLVVLLALALVVALYGAAMTWLAPLGIDPAVTAGLIALGIGVTVSYPSLRRGAHWFVDTVVLRRADYVALRAAIVQALATSDSTEDALREACERLAPALAALQWSCWRLDEGQPVAITGCCARGAAVLPQVVAEAYGEWKASDHAECAHADAKRTRAVAIVPTTEAPRFAFAIAGLSGGRRLLSDDLGMLESVARATANRIDRIRLAEERDNQRVREAEIRHLATEAELRALRAQMNPHFLFNALTTIGYLIQTAPVRALEKLMQLTELLRRVLRSEGDFTTLAKEMELVHLYLDLEHARFEERLRVEIDVPPALRDLTVPALVLQPLVENAIKHGIAPSATGGSLAIRARVEAPEPSAAGTLLLTVHDSGRAGVRGFHPASGIGLRNVEERLQHYYGGAAWLRFETTDAGTLVTLGIPVRAAERRPEMEARAL